MSADRPLTIKVALRLAMRCKETARPLGWCALRVLLFEREELVRQLAALREEVAGLTLALARKRGRGTAGEPR